MKTHRMDVSVLQLPTMCPVMFSDPDLRENWTGYGYPSKVFTTPHMSSTASHFLASEFWFCYILPVNGGSKKWIQNLI